MPGKFRLDKEFKKFKRRRPEEETLFPGILGFLSGGKKVVEVADRPGYVYVRLRSDLSEVIVAFNDNVALVYGLPVLVSRKINDKSRWIVSGKDLGRYIDWGDNGDYVSPHAPTHTEGGVDQVFVTSKQIIQLGVYAYEDMKVGVSPGLISSPQGVVRVAGEYLTITAPSTANKIKLDLIQVSLETGLPSVKAGTEFDLIDFSYAQIPQPDDNCMGIAAIRTHTGQTEISDLYNDSDIIDLRWLSISSGGSGTIATYHNYIIRYHGDTTTAYAPTAVGLAAALAASSDGDTITIPPYTYVGNFTVPAGVTVIGEGNETVLYGKTTVNNESWLQELKVTAVSTGTATAIAIDGPESGIALLWHVGLFAANTGTGDAICFNLRGGDIAAQLGNFRAQYTDGAATGRIAYSESTTGTCDFQFISLAGTDDLDDAAPANWKIAEGATVKLYGCWWHNGYDASSDVDFSDLGDRSPIDHTHANPDYPGLDTVAWFYSGSVTTYPATAVGLTNALAASAVPHDGIVTIPPMDFTGDFEVPQSVMMIGYGNVSRILGKVTLNHESWIQSLKVQNVAASGDPVVAIEGPTSGSALGWFVHLWAANTSSGSAYAVNLNGGSVTLRNGTARAQHTNEDATSRIYFSDPAVTGSYSGWLDYMSLLGTANLTDAAPAGWAITEGALVGLSNNEWHVGFVPTGDIVYASGDRSAINHKHVEADITDLTKEIKVGVTAGGSYYEDLVFSARQFGLSVSIPPGAEILDIELNPDQVFLDGGLVVNEGGLGSTSGTSDFRVEGDNEDHLLWVNSISGTVYIGGDTNAVRIGEGGELQLLGTATVWDDLRITPGSFDRPGSSDPGYVLYYAGTGTVGIYLPEWAKDNIASFTVQMPHSYAVGEDIYVHLHWTPGKRGNEENGNTVGWKIDYSWANIDGTFTAAQTANLSDACNGNDDDHQMTPEVQITGSGKNISSMLICNIRRTATGTDDTWVGTASGQLPLLLEVDFHYPIDTMGSKEKSSK